MTVGLALFWGQPFYFALIPVLVTGIQQRHVHGAEDFFSRRRRAVAGSL
jgi:hypothetical protein